MVLNKIGLTGATGMLGRHVRAALEKAGAKVVAVNRISASGSEVAGWDLADWRSSVELDALFSDVQAVVHVGAMVPRKSGLIDEGRMFDANVRACLNLGQWAISRDVPIVHISGAIVYAEPDREVLTENATLGWSGLGGFYGFSKLLAEDVFERLRRQSLKLAIVRPTSIYGYGLSADKMISHFLATAREGGTIELTPPVHDRVDFIHAADVAIAILAILKAESWDSFNIASGCAVSIKELAEACVSVTGRGSVLINISESQTRDPITRFVLDTDRARNHLGWNPQFDIKQGLRLMFQECLGANGCEL
jgi:nucleoside-diphosphate-sugar epimerase